VHKYAKGFQSYQIKLIIVEGSKLITGRIRITEQVSVNAVEEVFPKANKHMTQKWMTSDIL